MPFVINCNLQFCQIVRYQKNSLIGMPLSKLVPKQSLSFYKKLLLFQPRIPTTTKNHQSDKVSSDLYRLIALKLSFGSLEFFLAEFKLLEVSEMEKYLVLKIIPNVDGFDQVRMMVDKNLTIQGHNSKVMSVLGVPDLNLRNMKTGSKMCLDELIPGIKNLDEVKNGLQSVVGLKLAPFHSCVVFRLGFLNFKQRSKIQKFRAKVDLLDDCGHFLIRMWNVRRDIVGACSMVSLSVPSPMARKMRFSRKFPKSIEEIESSVLCNSFSLKPENVNQQGFRFEFRLNKKLQLLGTFFESSHKCELPRSKKISSSKSLQTASDHKSNTPATGSSDSETSGVIESMRRVLQLKMTKANSGDEINYAEGIRTLRLVGGDLRDVYDDEDGMMDSEDDSTFQADGSLFRHTAEFKNLKVKGKQNQTSKILSKKQRKSMFANFVVKRPQGARNRIQHKRKEISSIKCFKLVSTSWTIVTSILILIYSFNDLVQLDGLRQLIDTESNMVANSNHLQEVFYAMTELCLLNEGINMLYDTEYRNKMEKKKAESMEFMDLLTKRLEEVNNRFESIKPTLPEFKELMDVRLAEVVSIKTGEDTRNFT